MANIKVGEELIDIAEKIDNCQKLVDEALGLYINVMTEFEGQYKGAALDNIKQFCNSEGMQIKKLSDLYGKASTYITYAYNQMNFTDGELAQMIKNRQSIVGGKK
ncbi:hypothetical protein HBE96_25060 [Clostridium sp. P21]|uniref:Uncharacterized protein n=1 Tax=Clostridium muellerianum TaxID=2716538 RepID=A0A7Y0HRJ6_9CLOT|nr:hypothetical protein [Clostridium muellerianum]NMM65852.1 hypothetical protein [Clostridium muellerianum]